MVYNVFISHSWTYGQTYQDLVALLNQAPRFEFRDYSVPKDSPIHNAPTVAELRRAIAAQMSYASVVLVCAGVYATHSKWINEEVKIAKDGFLTSKPVIAVEPWGSQKSSTFVKENATTIVGWNTNSIVDAIRRYG